MFEVRAWALSTAEPRLAPVVLETWRRAHRLPADVVAWGTASFADGSVLLSQHRAPPAPTTLPALGPVRGTTCVGQLLGGDDPGPRRRDQAPPAPENCGPFRARRFAASFVGGPRDADAASAARRDNIAALPELLQRCVVGDHEAESLFLSVLADVHRRGLLDDAQHNGVALAEAARARVQPGPRALLVANGVDVVVASADVPVVLWTFHGLSEDIAATVDPRLVDSSTARERLRRFRAYAAVAGSGTLPAATELPRGASAELHAAGGTWILRRDRLVSLPD